MEITTAISPQYIPGRLFVEVVLTLCPPCGQFGRGTRARSPNSRYNWRVMLSVNNITMRFGPRVLFENVTCTFMSGRRYAITGPNGAGKSTFMKILTGEIDSTRGAVTRPKKSCRLPQGR